MLKLAHLRLKCGNPQTTSLPHKVVAVGGLVEDKIEHEDRITFYAPFINFSMSG
ncbi:hypothetical protein [Levilactobacillus huananensis]|uniref:hypothetical protein n=1 Tax=Levilactobacillus huananensis TaxID=2486019 RepID=UPI0013DDC226|nr:hypothetical protein [Levilactobacillus huananensis]